jgi:hypothetical protein
MIPRSLDMTRMIVRCATAVSLIISLPGCGLLDVSDPTAIKASDVQNAFGSDLLRRDAVRRLYVALSEGVTATGVLADELIDVYYFPGLDKRLTTSTAGEASYTRWMEVRRAASLAIPELVSHGSEATKRAYVSEMFAVRGYATLELAESFCSGFPLHEIVDFKPVYGAPLSTDQDFDRALADFDSALTFAQDSARILNLVRVGRARSLLGLGRYSAAAAAGAAVPSAFRWSAEYSSTLVDQVNRLGFTWQNNQLLGVGNRKGSNGLEFVTAKDPRLTTRLMFTTRGASYYAANKYPDPSAPIVIASGIEVRLIEAEAALKAGDPTWLSILNDLRATQISPAMTVLGDPGTDAARLDLVFRERAFWLFGTGHRLGDMRRLIGRYARPPESVFPTGPYYRGGFSAPPRGVYGPATSIPFPSQLETPYSPAVTGCTSP